MRTTEKPRAHSQITYPAPALRSESALDVPYFRTLGFVVIRQFFEARPIAAEIDHVMQRGRKSSLELSPSGQIHFQYVPMMTAETPSSLALLDRTETIAATLFESPVLPTRAKGVRYSGNTAWHTDSNLPIASLGIVTYFESLGEESGALRVLPGSHRAEFATALRSLGIAGKPAETLPSHTILTEPGDIIVFDEHLFHASSGGKTRRQWRVDYIADPANAEAEEQARGYFKELYRPDWDGGYDVDRYPSYGSDWLQSPRRAVARLEALGVYELAANQEAFARSRR
jgi:hypothetical protein